jgi:hypothetical protein
MTELETLERDIETVNESIRSNRKSLHERTNDELWKIIQHVANCREELEKLEDAARSLMQSRDTLI